MKTIRCEQCASTDLRRVSEGEYVCNHCKAQLQLFTPAAPKQPPRAAAMPRSLASRALFLIGIVAAVAAIATLRYFRAKERAEERQRRAIRRSVSESLAKRFGAARSGLNQESLDPEQRAIPAAEFSGSAVVAPKVVKAVFTDAVALPDSIGNVYFVGLYRNLGEATIDHPRVEATLWDFGKHKLAVGSGFAPFFSLVPGEEVPVKILVQRAPAYDSVSYRVEPEEARFGSARRFKLSVENPRLEPDSFQGYSLTGSVRNQDTQAVQNIQIIALLQDGKRQIVGMQEGYAGQRVLPPGDACPFRIGILQVQARPASFKLYTNALPVRN